MRRLLLLWGLSSALLACRESREPPAEPLSFSDVEPLLSQRCQRCHREGRAEGGYRVDGYYATLGCVSSGAPAVHEDLNRAPLLAVLSRENHRDLLSASERERLQRWLRSGAPGRPGVVHGADIMNPRSDGWHGTLAGRDQYAPLRDPESDGVCGQCHDGAPVRPAGVRFAAPDAPACTTCHTQNGAVLACSTCHGDQQRSFPPRDPCYFSAGSADAHAAHLTSTGFRSRPLECSSCHPVPEPRVFEGAHVNGTVDLAWSALAGAEARFNREDESCTVACHARAGQHPQPSWRSDLMVDCNSCHLSPPRDHYPGACSTCHAEMGSTPFSLTPGALHLDGRVGTGGPQQCGACHGEGDDPWPRETMHRLHRESSLTAAMDCQSCHQIPDQLHAAGHLDGQVAVRFSGRAVSSQAAANYEQESGRCTNVACHGGPLREARQVRWHPSGQPDAPCVTCHGAPPPPPHVQQPSCGGGLCHGGEVSGAVPAFGITSSGRALHIDGVVQAGTSP